VLALIYRGDIAYWDDPLIKSLNPTANLPHAEIKVLHRSDSSGTTQVFTYFLHKAAPSLWPETLVGKTIEWPVDATGRGLGGKGNEGVAGYFKQLDSAIAYVELGYAIENNFSIAAIMNRDGQFVLPTEATIQAAIKGAIRAGLLPNSPLDDWSNALDAIVYAPGNTSYSIVSFTFLITWTEYDPAKANALKTFIKFVNTDGQEDIIEGYSPIPVELRQINLKSLEIIRGASG
jgi:phosphate transport system substrate-binding protein